MFLCSGVIAKNPAQHGEANQPSLFIVRGKHGMPSRELWIVDAKTDVVACPAF